MEGQRHAAKKPKTGHCMTEERSKCWKQTLSAAADMNKNNVMSDTTQNPTSLLAVVVRVFRRIHNCIFTVRTLAEN